MHTCRHRGIHTYTNYARIHAYMHVRACIMRTYVHTYIRTYIHVTYMYINITTIIVIIMIVTTIFIFVTYTFSLWCFRKEPSSSGGHRGETITGLPSHLSFVKSVCAELLKSGVVYVVLTPWKINMKPTAITHLERNMIWTKPPWGHVPAINLPLAQSHIW